MAQSGRKIAELKKCLEINTKKQARKGSHEIETLQRRVSFSASSTQNPCTM